MISYIICAAFIITGYILKDTNYLIAAGLFAVSGSLFVSVNRK